jgi:hypothetical protein
MKECLKQRFVRMVVLLSVVVLARDVSASILWNFSTTDGNDTLSGQLTTDGTLADLAGPRLFVVESIVSLSLNGGPTPFFTDPPWVHPTSGDLAGSEFPWDGSAVQNPIFISAISVPGGDNFELDVNPALGGLRARIVGLVEFEPQFTLITPIPEPAVYSGVFGVGMLLWSWRHRRRNASAA